MVTLLMCLFIVLFAMSQVDKAKFAALASGLAHSFGAPITRRNDPSTGSQPSILNGLPDPVDIAAGVAPEHDLRRHQPKQVDAAAAQAAAAACAERPGRGGEGLRRARRGPRQDRRRRSTEAGYKGAARYQIDERGLVVHIVADAVLFDAEQATLRPEGAKSCSTPWPRRSRACPTSCASRATPTSSRSTPAARGRRTGSCPPTGPPRCCGTSPVTACPSTRMSAAGYGSTQPLVPYSDPQAITVNRRVDIVVLSTASRRGQRRSCRPGRRRCPEGATPMSTRTRTSPRATETEAKGGKKKLLVIVAVAVLAAGGRRLLLPLQRLGEAKAAPKPGTVVTLDPVAVNLAGGGYLKVGVSLQLTADAGETKPRRLQGHRPDHLDVLAGPPADVIGAREALKAALQKKIIEAYRRRRAVMGIYYTDYVTQ